MICPYIDKAKQHTSHRCLQLVARRLTSACLFVGRPSVCRATVMLSACSIWYSQPCLFLSDCSRADSGEDTCQSGISENSAAMDVV